MAEEQINNQMSPQERERGLRYILYDGMASQVMVSLSGGAFMIAFALLLGASNLTIGLLAAGPFLGNIFQIPAALVIERIGRRKLISILGSLVSRAWLLVFALIPLVFMELSLTFRWLASEGGWTAYLLNFKGLDFLFFVAFILGLYALHRLSLVQEKGEVPKKVVYREFLSETRRAIRNISSVSGLSQLVYLPIALYTRRERQSK